MEGDSKGEGVARIEAGSPSPELLIPATSFVTGDPFAVGGSAGAVRRRMSGPSDEKLAALVAMTRIL